MTRQKKRPKVVVMSASGQTDAERRHLRQSQRQLQRKIVNEGESLENPDSEAFDKIRQDNNALWDKVRYTREAVLDGDNLEMISTRAARQVDKLVQVPRYDSERLARKLREKFGNAGNFEWKNLGKEAGACFNSVASGVSFLYGPVDAEYVPKQKKQREKKKRQIEEEEEEEEEDVQEKDKSVPADADKLSAGEKTIKDVSKTLKKRCHEVVTKEAARLEESDEGRSMDQETKKKHIKTIKRDGICAVQYMFNPRSFTQTVENIFHFSFLVKKGEAGIKIVKDDDGNVRPMVRATTRSDNMPESRQTIVTLSMKDWRNLVQAYNVDKSDIPHRTGSRHAPPSASK